MTSPYNTGSQRNLRGPKRRTVTEVDEVAVERLLGGDRHVIVAAVDRAAAIDYLDGLGMSMTQVAVRLGISNRTVTRRRAARRAAA